TQVSGPTVSLSGTDGANASFVAPTVTEPTSLTFKVRVTDARGASDTDLVHILVNPPINSYVVQSGDTWSSISQVLYGTSAVASDLQSALGNPALTVGATLSSLPSSLSGYAIALQKPADVLSEGIPVSHISSISPSGTDWHYYAINVPAGTKSLSIAQRATDAGARLYARAGAQPDEDNYDAFGWRGNSLYVDSPAEGTWYIGVYGDFQQFADVEIEAHLEPTSAPAQVLIPGEAVTDIGADESVESERLFTFDVPAGVSNFRVDLYSPKDSIDLYLNPDTAPISAGYQFQYGSFGGVHQTIYVNNANPRTWYAMVKGFGNITDAKVVLSFNTENTAPTVSAGDGQSVYRGDTVQLNAQGNDAESGVGYEWTQLEGPPVQLSDNTTSSPTFTAPNVVTPTSLTFKVVVTDNRGAKASDIVRVLVNAPVSTYVVADGDTWTSIAQKLYGNTAVAQQLEAALGSPTLTSGMQLSGMPDHLSATLTFNAVSTDGANTLHSGVALSGISIERDAWSYYTIDVPEGTEFLTLRNSGGEDLAMLARQGALPTWDDRDGYAFGSQDGAGLVLRNPAAGRWYIGLNAWADVANVTLEARTQAAGDSVTTLIPGETINDMPGGDHDTYGRRVFRFEVPEGVDDFQLDLRALDSGAELYLRRDVEPDLDNYVYYDRAAAVAGGKQIYVADNPAGVWYATFLNSSQLHDTDLLLTLNTRNIPPQVDASAVASSVSGASVQLDAAGSDTLGALTYQWEQIEGPAVTLANAATAQASFDAPSVTADTVLA
ncbi:MAG TPA: pre-peptidase C-terminal domain-containing protein, partial [Steroidobacteraceae bacterium]|nr:pre-peptidase C-terminal domain-containing protein [Steroidobacteraceae bacterium]